MNLLSGPSGQAQRESRPCMLHVILRFEDQRLLGEHRNLRRLG